MIDSKLPLPLLLSPLQHAPAVENLFQSLASEAPVTAPRRSGKTTFLNSHQQSCADHAAIELRFAAELRKVPPAASTSTAGGAAPPKVIVLERRLAEQAPASAPSPGAAGSADAAPGAAAEDAAAADMVADAIAAAELLEALFEPVPAGCEFSLDRFERFAGQRNRGKLRAILRETTRRLG